MDKPIVTILTDTPIAIRNLPGRVLEFLKMRGRKLMYLLTRNPKFLPDAEISETIASIQRGFADLKITYSLNPWKKITGAVLVIASPEALSWALQEKKKGLVKTVIAGPGISALPTDHNRLIADPAIDKVIVPTGVVKTHWTEDDQYFDGKAVVWTAGVADDGTGRISDGVCVVYSRNADEKLFSHIMETLWSHKVPIAVSNYGQFRSREYVRLLKKAKFLIYLDNFENQPLPLYEAWMADVPALVFGEIEGLVPPGCGLLFKSSDDFETKLLEFQEKYASFHPRPYALTHYTDSISAGKLRSIIEMK